MPQDNSFADLMRRVRSGDKEAADEIFLRFGKPVRTFIRYRLGNRLRRVFDSEDIYQSVLKDFLEDISPPNYAKHELETPEELLAFLNAMASHNIANKGRRTKNTFALNPRSIEALQTLLDDSPGPDQIAEAKELLNRAREKFTQKDWELINLKLDGCTWETLGAQEGLSGEAIRKRLTRAIELVREHLGQN